MAGLHSNTIEHRSPRTRLQNGCLAQEHESIFLVGTEEGSIHKCSSAHRTGYLQTYLGHEMSVYAVRWCPVQPQAFLSASADWTVKLWHGNEAKAGFHKYIQTILKCPIQHISIHPAQCAHMDHL